MNKKRIFGESQETLVRFYATSNRGDILFNVPRRFYNVALFNYFYILA